MGQGGIAVAWAGQDTYPPGMPRFLLLVLAITCSTAAAAAPSVVQVPQILGNPAALKPTSVRDTKTDSGATVREWLWGKKYQGSAVSLEIIGGNRKAWLWKTENGKRRLGLTEVMSNHGQDGPQTQ